MALPKLSKLRSDIKTHLEQNTSLKDDQIIIKRHQNPWDVIAACVGLADNGIALHLSESSGSNTNTAVKGNNYYDVEIIFTLVSNYKLPNALETEEIIFEEIVLAMASFVSQLFSTTNQPCGLATATMLGWSHIPIDFDYYCRAMTYRFPVIFK